MRVEHQLPCQFTAMADNLVEQLEARTLTCYADVACLEPGLVFISLHEDVRKTTKAVALLRRHCTLQVLPSFVAERARQCLVRCSSSLDPRTLDASSFVLCAGARSAGRGDTTGDDKGNWCLDRWLAGQGPSAAPRCVSPRLAFAYNLLRGKGGCFGVRRVHSLQPRRLWLGLAWHCAPLRMRATAQHSKSGTAVAH